MRDLSYRMSIHNRFDVEVIDAITGEIKQKAVGYNTICDHLWECLLGHDANNQWNTSSRYFATISFGKGTGTISSSDRALFDYLGSKWVVSHSGSGTTIIQPDHDPVYNFNFKTGVFYRTSQITLAADEYVGQTITEVGISVDSSSSAPTICSHALLTDMQGNPISVSKTSTDIIEIYATVYIHISSNGWYNSSIQMLYRSNYETFFKMLLGESSTASLNNNYYLDYSYKRTRGYTNSSIRSNITKLLVNSSTKKIYNTIRIDANQANWPIRMMTLCGPSTQNAAPIMTIKVGSWFNAPTIEQESVGVGDGSQTGFSTVFPVKTPIAVYIDGVLDQTASFRIGPADISSTGLADWFNEMNQDSYGNWEYEFVPELRSRDDNSLNLSSGTDILSDAFENDYCQLGIDGFYIKASNSTIDSIKILSSDDLENWDEVSITTTKSSDYLYYALASTSYKKYWRFQGVGSITHKIYFRPVGHATDISHNIVFQTPPAANANITVDYVPDCIPKDANHVFDFYAEFTFGEYQGV